MIPRFARSLSARLLGIFLATSIVYAIASDFAVQAVLDRDYLREIIGAHIGMHSNYVLNDLGSPPRVEKAIRMAESNPLDIRIVGPGIDWASDPAFPDLDEIPFESTDFFDRIKASGEEGQAWRARLDQLDFARFHRHSFVRVRDGDYQIAFVTPKISIVPVVPDVTAPLVLGLISILVLAGCYFAVRWLIRPIKWIKEGAGRIGQGDLDYRIPRVRKDDLGELTMDINRMADDVQEMLEAKRQLLLAISHELRSPLTRARVALALLDDEDMKAGLLDDITEMEQLIDSLLEGERLSTRHSKLQLADTDLSQLVRELVRDEFGETRGRIDVSCPAEPLSQKVDPTRVRLMVKNLLDNALCYASEDGAPIDLTLERTPGGARLTVSDHGPGMTPGEVERATEPFYRADPARCRETGGVGLGLYLCRRIAEAHRGTLTINSVAGRGTQVTVDLPAGDLAAAA